eukprot:CFRG3246T1
MSGGISPTGLGVLVPSVVTGMCLLKMAVTKTAPDPHDQWSMKREKQQLPKADQTTLDHYYSRTVGVDGDWFLTRLLAKGIETPEQNKARFNERITAQTNVADDNLDFWSRPTQAPLKITNNSRGVNFRGVGISD